MTVKNAKHTSNKGFKKAVFFQWTTDLLMEIIIGKHFECVYLLNIHIEFTKALSDVCGYFSKQLFFPDNTKAIINATKSMSGQ